MRCPIPEHFVKSKLREQCEEQRSGAAPKNVYHGTEGHVNATMMDIVRPMQWQAECPALLLRELLEGQLR